MNGEKDKSNKNEVTYLKKKKCYYRTVFHSSNTLHRLHKLRKTKKMKQRKIKKTKQNFLQKKKNKNTSTNSNLKVIRKVSFKVQEIKAIITQEKCKKRKK